MLLLAESRPLFNLDLVRLRASGGSEGGERRSPVCHVLGGLSPPPLL